MTETIQSWRRESDDEPGFMDPWGTIRPYWPWILACAAVVAAAALVLSLMSSPAWEAQAAILPGYLAQPGQPTPQPVELVARTAERLRARSFGDAVLAKSGLPISENDPQARLFRDSLKITQTLNTDVIHITLRAYSPRLAAQLVQGMIDNLRSVHGALLEPSVTRFRQDLANVQTDLSRGREERERLERLRETGKVLTPANRFSESVELGNLVAKKTEEIQTLEQRRLQIEEALNPAKSHTVLEVDKVNVKQRPVSPKPLRNTFLGALVGLFVGAFGVLLFKSIQTGPIQQVSGASREGRVAGAGSTSGERALRDQ
jgi:uncharacterized protein involved in exopolysaccharide biosynthesis